MSDRPIVAVTLGDVAGIGPEVTVRMLADPLTARLCRPVVVGDPDVLRSALKLTGLRLQVSPVDGPIPAADSGDMACWSPRSVARRAGGPLIVLPDDLADVRPGAVDPRAGLAAYGWLVAATQAAVAGEIDALVTAPLHKFALQAGGFSYPGHTEVLAEECGVSQFAMMLFVPPGRALGGAAGLGVAHVTLHTAVRSVPELLSTAAIVSTIRLVDRFMKTVGSARPRIGVCALNPHAGEQGRFGDEEQRLIAPAVHTAALENIDVQGPIAADALMRRSVAGEFDGVVAMYHDQGHIALKLVAFNQAVNVTLGLPIVRTSPSHGTAFDIAGRGIADASGMLAALETAVALRRAGR